MVFEFAIAPLLSVFGVVANADTVNSSTEQKLVNFTVSKKWTTGSHPSSVTVNLMANGKKVKSEVLSSVNNWKYTWSNLSNTDSNGNLISYSVTENPVAGFKSSYSSVKTTNSGESATVWLPATHWESGHQYIMTTSSSTGNVNALQDCGKNWQWNGHTINVSGPDGQYPYPRYITNQEAEKDGGSFIWTPELYASNVRIDHLNGLHDVYTLVGNNGQIASLQGAQDMVDYNHRSQTNCQWFFGGYQGGQNQPAVPQSSWKHVMGGADFYYPLSEGGTGDGNHKNIPLWYAYEQQTVTANKQTQTITNNVD